MSKVVQWKRGNTSATTSYTGYEGEITVNTDTWNLHVHDGYTPGGWVIDSSNSGGEFGNLSAGNVAVTSAITTDTLVATGNITANYFIGNGSLLTGISTYSDADVATYLSSGNVTSNIITTGNIAANNVAVTNDINISGSGDIVMTNGKINTSRIRSIGETGQDLWLEGETVVTIRTDEGGSDYDWTFGIDGNLSAPGAISALGNVTASYFIGNGSLLAGISSYSDANVAAYLPTYTGNLSANNVAVTNDINISGSGDIVMTNGKINTSRIRSIGETGQDLWLEGETVVTIRTDEGGSDYDWTFQIDGSLRWPNGSTQTTAYTGYDNANVVAYSEAGFAGNIIPSANVTYTLGNATNQWASLYVSGNTIYLDNVPLSVTGNALTVDGTSVATTTDITTANTDMKSYVDNEISTTQGQITTANTDMKSYVDNEISTTQGQITTANTDMKSYVDNEISGIGAHYSDANVVSLLSDFGSNAIVTTGNVTAGNILTNNYFYANGDPFVSSNYGDSNVAAYLPTYTGNLSPGNILTNNYFYANGDPFVSSNYGDSNVAAYLPTYTGNLSPGNVSVSGNITGNTNGYTIGYRDIPQIVISSNVTVQDGDQGKHYYSTQSTDYTITVPNNATTAFSIGSAINIVNRGSGNLIVSPDSGVNVYLAGNTVAGSRSISSYGAATLQKVETDVWFLVGVGVN